MNVEASVDWRELAGALGEPVMVLETVWKGLFEVLVSCSLLSNQPADA